MPVSKLKNLVILILLMANLLLMLVVIPTFSASSREQAALLESLQTLYANQDIALDAAAVPDTVSLYTLELKEDSQANDQAASALLGSQLLVQDDSTRYLSIYRSDQGSCSISYNGTFEAELTGQPECSDLSKDASKTLKSIGFTYDSLGEPERIRAGVFSLTAVQSVLGVPVFTGVLTLTYANNRLTSLEGTFFTGTASSLARVSDQACISAADALVAFLSARYDLGWVGSAVTSMEQGYIRSETAAAAVIRLTPGWRLHTDTGSFWVNGITGEIVAS